MNRFVPALFFALACQLLTARTLDGTETASPSAADISNLLTRNTPVHPRLFLKAGAETGLLVKIETSPHLMKIRAEIIANAETLLTTPPLTRVMVGRRMLDTSRTCLRRVTTLSMAWRLTKNQRYLDRARNEMLAAAAFPDWNPSHFLDVAEMTAALAIGYDWLYPALDAGTRATLRKAIVEKGLQPSFNGQQFWINGTNNWNQVCNSGLALGALAVAEDEPKLAATVIARSIAGLPHAMHGYAPDGNYPEGPGYWTYGTSYNVLLLAGLESVFGSDFNLSQQPGFLASSDYMVNVTGPTGLFHNYSDSGSKHGTQAPLYWFAAKRHDPSVLCFEEGPLHVESKAGKEGDGWLPFILLWANPTTQASTPRTLDWTGRGPNPVAFFRSGWDRNALFVGIKGGSPSENHGHMDAGSFVLDALGVRWALDLGAQSYESLESRGIKLWDKGQDSDRWKIFRLSNQSHNVLLINNQPQLIAGKAEILTRDLETNDPQAELDCSSLFTGQALKVMRIFSLPDRKALRITDKIQSVAATGTVRWQMATTAEVILSGTETLLRKDGKTLRVKRVGPDSGVWSVVDISKPQRDYDVANPGAKLLVLDLPVTAGDSPELTVELTPQP